MEFNVTFSNDYCKLAFHRQSLQGAVRDYIISFTETEADMEMIATKTYSVFEQLMDTLKDHQVKARLIAEIEFESMFDDMDVTTYHFGSYGSETVYDASMFYEDHMSKIISRLDNFNPYGNILLLRRIKHIYVAVTVL